MRQLIYTSSRLKSWEIDNLVDDFIDELQKYHGFGNVRVISSSLEIFDSLPERYQSNLYRFKYYTDCLNKPSVMIISRRAFEIIGRSGHWYLRLRERDTSNGINNTLWESKVYRTRQQIINSYTKGELC
jgi:hypothetical protein